MTRNLIVIAVYLFLAINVAAHEGNTYTINMYADHYEPKNITIKQNDSITFVNKSQQARWPASNIHPTHEIYSEFDPKKALSVGEKWNFEFTKAGVWRYHDHLTPTIVGAITVENDTHTTPTPRVSIVKKAQNLWTRAVQYFKLQYATWTIRADTQDIWTDDDALLAYIHRFGAEKTIAHLHTLESEGFGDCHQRAHKAGRLTYALLKEKAFARSPFECHSGYFHGVMESFFREKGTQNLGTHLKAICTQFLGNGFASHQCLHGIGHGLMAWSDYELYDALTACDLLNQGHESCYSGVFMENVVGGIAKDDSARVDKQLDTHFTKYLSSDPQYPCTVVDDKYKGSCYFFQTSRMIQLFGTDFSKISDTCQQVPREYQTLCFSSMGRDVSGVHQKDLDSILAGCALAPAGVPRVECAEGAVSDIFWDAAGADRALTFCSRLATVQEKSRCYDSIVIRATQVLNKSDMGNFCNKLDTAGYKRQCLNAISL